MCVKYPPNRDTVFTGLKKYSDWPTYPQLYGNGELIGGLDIIRELVESGELKSQLPQEVLQQLVLKQNRFIGKVTIDNALYRSNMYGQ